MKVLTIGTDRKLFEKGSPVQARVLEYAARTEEMHVIVMSLSSLGLEELHIGNLHVYPTNSSSRLLYIRDAIRLGKRLITEQKLYSGVVISAQDPFETGWVGYRLARCFKLPLQLQVHTDFASNYFWKGSFLNMIRILIAQYIIPSAQGIRTVSESTAAYIRKTYPSLESRVRVLPIYVDVQALAQEVPEWKLPARYPQYSRFVLMVSRLAKEKRIDVAISAFKKVTESFPGAALVIVGEGPEKKHLQVCAEYNQVSASVIFAGWETDLTPYYKTADVFLLTSEYEGYGMSLIEAAASGCPIVTTRVGVADSPLFTDGENCFVCPIGDRECLSSKIEMLLHDDSLRELFKTRMRDSINHVLSRDAYVASYIGLLEELLPEHS